MRTEFGSIRDGALFIAHDEFTGEDLLFLKDDGHARSFVCTGLDVKGGADI